MNRYFYFVVTLLLLAACAKTETPSNSITEQTISFVSDKPDFDDATKTAWNGSAVVWGKDDQMRFACLKNGTNWQNATGDSNKPKAYLAEMKTDEAASSGVFSATTSFTFDSQEDNYRYYTVFPASAFVPGTDFNNAPSADIVIKEAQELSSSSFDSSADVMIGRSINSYKSSTESISVPLQWKRLVAFSEITFTNIQAEDTESISSITLTAQSDAQLTGSISVDIVTGAVDASSASNKVSVSGDLIIDNGSATAWFVTLPYAATSLKIEIETDKAKYTREVSSLSLDFLRNQRNTLTINMATAERETITYTEVFKKVTSDLGDWTGEYLIVYESESIAFDGSLVLLDAVSNFKSVKISDNKIVASKLMKSISFSVAEKEAEVYNLKSASGYYISGTKMTSKASNGMVTSSSDADYEISFGLSNSNAIVYSKSSDQNMVLKYNAAEGSTRFRFYKSGANIALYKLVDISGGEATEVTAPTLDKQDGNYIGETTVKVSNYNDSYVYFYTLNGEVPVFDEMLDAGTNTLEYDNSVGIAISTSCTLKIIAVDVDGNKSSVTSATYTIEQSIQNTISTAYTTAQAISLIDGNSSQLANTKVYVKGVVSSVVKFNDQYKSITYWLDEGTFEVFGGLMDNGDSFTSIDDVNVGDEVIVFGLIKKYGSTYEFDQNSWLVSQTKASALSISNIVVAKGDDIKPEIVTNVKGEYLIEYSSDNENVVIADGDELITGEDLGTATISATLVADGYKTAETSFTVTVTSSASLTGISIEGTPASNVYTVGDSFNTSSLSVVATYDDNSTADVTADAVITVSPEILAVSTNSVSVTASYGGTTAQRSFDVTVNKKAASISIADISLTVGNKKNVVATTTPSNAALTYAITEGADYISITNGEITANAVGTATVKASFAGNDEYNECEKSFSVTVDPANNPIHTLSFTKLTTGTNYNSYTGAHTTGGWNVYGNQSVGDYLRVGGKNTTATDRTLTSTNAITGTANYVVISHSGIGNGKSSSITINSISVEASSSSSFPSDETEKVTKTSPSVSDSGNLRFDFSSSHVNAYYRIKVNYQISGSNNCYITIDKVEIY